MPCTSAMKHKYIFKTGDVLILPMRLVNRIDGVSTPVELKPSITLAASIHTAKGKAVATLLVEPYEDQLAYAGWYTASTTTDTSNWPTGDLVLDVKVTIGGQSKHTPNFTFYCEGSIT